MATEVETLLLRLEATQAKFEKQMKAAYNSADRNSRKIENRFARMNKSVGGSFNALQGVMVKAFAAAAAARGAQRLLDSATRIENALKVAGLEGENLTAVYGKLFQSAQKNAAPLEALVTLFGRASLVQKELGVSQEEMIGFTDRVAVALRVSGKSAAESSGALLQLSQALGSGIVRAEEFNSIMEGAQPIAQAAAAGLDEAGGSVAKLRQLVVDGKVSSEAFFRAFEAGSVILEQKVAGAELTVSQQFTRLQNVLIDTAGKFDDATGASRALGGVLEAIADYIESAGNAFAQFNAGPIAEFIGTVTAGVNATANLIEKLTELPALLGAAKIAGQVMSDAMMGRSPGSSTAAGAQEAYAEKRLHDAFNFPEDKRTPTTGRLKRAAAVKTVSLDDYALPASSKKKGGGGSRQNDFAREVEQIKERTAALQVEMQVMSGLNPLVDDYGFAMEKALAAQELETAAKKAGLQITPQLSASINELATSYAQASVDAERLAESQDKARESAEEMKSLGKDVMSGFISDLRQGKSASEALAGALNKVADKLIDIALNSIFDGGGIGGLLGGGRSGGLLGGLLIPGILHSGGVAGSDGYGHGRVVSPTVFSGAKRYHQGGVAGLQPGEVPAILQKGEVVIPKGGSVKNGGFSISMPIKIDATGADAAGLARVEREIQGLKSSLPGLVIDTVTEAQRRRVL